MKAVVWTRYGPPEALVYQEVDTPEPQDNEMRIRVHAASINSWDWELMRRKGPESHVKPPHRVLGCDIAGIVEKVGSGIMRFKVGDEVFGDISKDGWGGFAEYVCVKEDRMALKSPKLSFQQAAAMPQSGVLALQGLRKGHIGPGMNVLINGAGRGVGTFAIQMAKSYGAEVTGVDIAEKHETMRSLGADHVIDHAKEDFIQNGQRYDLIIDVWTTRPFLAYRKVLAPKGKCILIGGHTGKILTSLLIGSWALGPKKVRLLFLNANRNDLEHLNTLAEGGKARPVIDSVYPLERTSDAFRHYATGKATGKVVIDIP
jgi:NADPH:quinone reductase-like Zn-dependent oxidoreductase